MLSSFIFYLSDLEDVAVVSLTVTWPFILLGILDRAVAISSFILHHSSFKSERR